MKRLLLLLTLYSSLALAQTATTVTGTFKDLAQNLITSGKVTFTLSPSTDATMSGLARFVNLTITCLINSSGQLVAQSGSGPCLVTMNTALQPPGSGYIVGFWPYNVETTEIFMYAVASSVDITTVISTQAQLPSLGGVMDTFTNQTVNGNKTFAGLSSFPGGINGSLSFSGPATTSSLNGVLNPTSCGGVNPPSWCSGIDVGGWINAAMANCSGLCDIYIPAGSWTYATTINVTSIGVSLHGAGSRATHLFYAGSGDAIDVQPSPQTTIESGVFGQFTIENSGSGVSGIHVIDTNQLKLYDVTVRGFTGSSSAGFWFDDQASDWSERDTCIDCFSYNNFKGFRFTNNGGTGSFARFHCVACYVNVEASQFGISAETGANVYDSNFDVSGNLDNVSPAPTLISVDGTSVIQGQFSIRGESDASGGGVCVSLASGAFLSGEGLIDCSNSPSPVSNSINAGAHFLITGGHDPLEATFSNSGIGPWIVPNTVNSLEGLGLNARWDGSNWQCNGDGGNNGCGLVAADNADGSVRIYSIASTGGSNKAISNTTMAAALTASFFPSKSTGYNIPIVTSFTTTAATSDNVTVTGMTSAGHCSLTATNSGAAGGIASVYVSAKTTNQITVTHTATSGWTFDVMCTLN